jgi:hypothetical protein
LKTALPALIALMFDFIPPPIPAQLYKTKESSDPIQQCPEIDRGALIFINVATSTNWTSQLNDPNSSILGHDRPLPIHHKPCGK